VRSKGGFLFCLARKVGGEGKHGLKNDFTRLPRWSVKGIKRWDKKKCAGPGGEKIEKEKRGKGIKGGEVRKSRMVTL